MWHGGAIRLTPSRLVAVAVAGRAPASGGDGSTAARGGGSGWRGGEGRAERPYMHASPVRRVTLGGHLRATAARASCVRLAPRTDWGSAARTVRYGGVAGAARGA
jgi:hypothetical protein